MGDDWLRDCRANAEHTAALDKRMAMSEMEIYAIDEAAMILRLLDEIERLRALNAVILAARETMD